MEWRVKILWNPKMFIIFVSTKGSFPLKEISCQRAQNEAFSIMPSAAEIAVRKYFECVSNDFRDRFCPVGKSSRKTALFYLMRYYFLSGHKYAAQSKHRESGVVLGEIVVSTLINEEIIFRHIGLFHCGFQRKVKKKIANRTHSQHWGVITTF